MANYLTDFYDYMNFIHKKMIKSMISDSYSLNVVKLGNMFNSVKCTNPEVVNWLQTFHQSCKTSKLDVVKDDSICQFKIRLGRVSNKIFDELYTRHFDRVKLKKTSVMKKSSKLLPSQMQSMISDIACYISETLSEKDIDELSSDVCTENVLKRKKFSRKIKESLMKYFKEFPNIIEGATKNGLESTKSELQRCLEQFDLQLPDCGSVRREQLEASLGGSDLAATVTTSRCAEAKQAVNLMDFTELESVEMTTPEEESLVCSVKVLQDEVDEFAVVDEWTEMDCDDAAATDAVEEKSSQVFLEEVAAEMAACLQKTAAAAETAISASLTDLQAVSSAPDNVSVSNICDNLSLEFRAALNAIVERSLLPPLVAPDDDDDLLIRSRPVFNKSSSRPAIKILSLKKPDVYASSPDKTESAVSNERICLSTIPLPNSKEVDSVNSQDKEEKIEDDEEDEKEVEEDRKENSQEENEEEDNELEERLPDSILDFTELTSVEEETPEVAGTEEIVEEEEKEPTEMYDLEEDDGIKEGRPRSLTPPLMLEPPTEEHLFHEVPDTIPVPSSIPINNRCYEVSMNSNLQFGCYDHQMSTNEISPSMRAAVTPGNRFEPYRRVPQSHYYSEPLPLHSGGRYHNMFTRGTVISSNNRRPSEVQPGWQNQYSQPPPMSLLPPLFETLNRGSWGDGGDSYSGNITKYNYRPFSRHF